MSMLYCPNHGPIDTDFNAEHFDDDGACQEEEG